MLRRLHHRNVLLMQVLCKWPVILLITTPTKSRCPSQLSEFLFLLFRVGHIKVIPYGIALGLSLWMLLFISQSCSRVPLHEPCGFGSSGVSRPGVDFTHPSTDPIFRGKAAARFVNRTAANKGGGAGWCRSRMMNLVFSRRLLLIRMRHGISRNGV